MQPNTHHTSGRDAALNRFSAEHSAPTRALLTFAMLASLVCATFAGTIDFSGKWRFKLDPNSEGITNRWFDQTLPDSLALPGSCQEQGFGEIPSTNSQWTVDGSYTKKIEALPHFKPFLEKNGTFRHPFWWTPDRLYVGAAWYQKEINVPENWRGTAIHLELERVHWESQLWIDDQPVGMQNGMGTLHEYDLTKILTPGNHRVTVCVDNRIKEINLGAGGHALSDHTQGNWNGIVGRIVLVSMPAVAVEHVRVDATDYQRKVAKLRFELVNLTAKPADVRLDYQAKTVVGIPYEADAASLRSEIPAHSTKTVELSYSLGKDAPLWNEFDPAVFTLSATLTPVQAGKATVLPQTVSTTFGIRKIETKGNAILVNGRKIFLRGTLDCCIWPLTGYPPTDKASWLRVFQIVKAHGLNHVRYHSWTPPAAAYEAADELGVYLQPEMLMWVKFGDGAPVDKWIKQEAERMFRDYGNHPSFALMAIGNECTNPKNNYPDETITAFQKEDPRRLYTDNISRSFSKLCDYEVSGVKFSNRKTNGVMANKTDYDPNDYFAATMRPTITHEDGQWASWPNMAEESKYTGILHPYYLDIYRDLMKQAGLFDRYHDYFQASGKLQTSLYKATMEASLKAPNCAGVQLLDLRDFPGQGYAPIGILDPFWESKGYCTAEEFRSFCDETVPLARFKSYVYENDQLFDAKIVVAHYGPENLAAAKVTWKLASSETVIGQGEFTGDLPTGTVTEIGRVNQSLVACSGPTRATLTVAMPGTRFKNEWPVWIYPSAKQPVGEDVLVASEINDAVRNKLENGGSVLLAPQPSSIQGDTTGAYASIFWTRVMFMKAKVHTLGAYVNAGHPALAEFPTESFTDWQWYDLMEHSKPVLMASFPRELRPVVEPIDDWNNPRPLGLIFEAKVGAGKLLFCAIDITSDLESRPVAAQLRHSLLAYMSSGGFNPNVAVNLEQFEQVTSGAVSKK